MHRSRAADGSTARSVHPPHPHIGAAVAVAAASCAAVAQTSASYDMKAHVVNEGGHPLQGAILSSGSFRMGLDSVGTGRLRPDHDQRVLFDGGRIRRALPRSGRGHGRQAPRGPPHPRLERGAGRGALQRLPRPGPDASWTLRRVLGGAGPATTVTDDASPGTGAGFFYLVTADNTLDEEGTKGFTSAGAQRANLAPCPDQGKP